MAAVKPALVAWPPSAWVLQTGAELGQRIKHLEPVAALTPEGKPPPAPLPPPGALLPELLLRLLSGKMQQGS